MDPSLGQVKILETLRPFFTEMGRRRHTLRRRLMVLVLSGVVVSFFLGLYFAGAEARQGRLIWVPVPALLAAIYLRTASKRYERRYKSSVFSAATSLTFPTLRYAANGVVPHLVYANCDLFERRPDVYQGEDLFSGTIAGVKVAFSEVRAAAKVQGGRGKIHEQPLFRGVIFQAEFSKQLQHVTTVLPLGPFNFSHLARPFMGVKRERMQVDGGQFGQIFQVYSSNPEESRAILTSAFMDRLVALAIHFDHRPVRISFIANRMTLAVGHGKDRFDSSLWGSTADMDNVHFFVKQVTGFATVVDTLKRTRYFWNVTSRIDSAV